MQDTIEGREGPPDQDKSRARNPGRCWLTPPQPGEGLERVMGIEPTWALHDPIADQSVTSRTGPACDSRV